MFGKENSMSPDDHYQDLKRVIQAISGKAHRINVIMPILYGGRQHRRSYRESLDCALALEELVNMGVNNIITFDAHDPRVQNAIPLHGFDNFTPPYQFIKALLAKEKNLKIDKKALFVTGDKDDKVVLSARNIPTVKTAFPGTMNVYDIMNAGTLVLTKDAVAKIEEVYA